MKIFEISLAVCCFAILFKNAFLYVLTEYNKGNGIVNGVDTQAGLSLFSEFEWCFGDYPYFDGTDFYIDSRKLFDQDYFYKYSVDDATTTGIDWDNASIVEGTFEDELVMWPYFHGYNSTQIFNFGKWMVGQEFQYIFQPEFFSPKKINVNYVKDETFEVSVEDISTGFSNTSNCTKAFTTFSVTNTTFIQSSAFHNITCQETSENKPGVYYKIRISFLAVEYKIKRCNTNTVYYR